MYIEVLLIIVIGFLVQCTLPCLAQQFNIGYPPVDNFTPTDYNGGTQNWRLDSSPDGVIYAANNDGLLSFDGYEWKVHYLPNRTIARSIDYNNDTIYIGGQDELGYFTTDQKGEFSYHSLWEKIPKEYQDITDIWDIAQIGNTTYFRNWRNIYKLNDKGFEVISSDAMRDFLSLDNQTLRFNKQGSGIFEKKVNEDAFQLNRAYSPLAEYVIINVISIEKNAYVFTESNGIYILKNDQILEAWASNAQPYLQKNEITAAIRLTNGNFAIGTRLGGLLVLDGSGNTLYVIDKSKGLQSNSVTCILEDNWSNLWIGTYFGIDRVNFVSGFNSFFPDDKFEGAVYDIALWNNHWWFATSNGLYSMSYQSYTSPFLENNLNLINQSEGQVWGLDIIDDQLFVAHHNGAYYVDKNDQLISLNIVGGAWKYIKLNNDHMAIGGYFGIHIFRKIGYSWKKLYQVDDFEESSRILITDNQEQLWISHPYRSLVKISFSTNFEDYNIQKYYASAGFQCEQGNYIFNVSGDPVVTNPCGIFRYEPRIDSFIKDLSLQAKIGPDQQVIRLFDQDEGLWYISEEETGVLVKNPTPPYDLSNKKSFPHIGKSFVGGFENLYPLDSNSLILCTNKGIKFYQSKFEGSMQSVQALVTKFSIPSSGRLLNLRDEKEFKLGPNERDLTVYFRSNGLINEDLRGFEYRLEGSDEGWTFSKLPFKEYSNLEAGNYTFSIRVVDNLGNKSVVTKIPFEIEEKWFKSTLAKIIFLFILGLVMALILIIPRKKYKKDTANLVIKQQETQKELDIVKQEKLEDEIRYKTNELANATLHLLQKKQTIDALRHEVKLLQKGAHDPKIKASLKNLNALLLEDDRLEDDWEKFSLLFDQVHLDFLHRLQIKYPQLTPKDQKLCGFLRMNLSTKEIAPLMNISARGVEISRYRLRKKMKLESSVNITEMMMKF